MWTVHRWRTNTPLEKKKIIISFYSTQRKRKIILSSSSSPLSARKCGARWSTIFFTVKITFKCSNIVMYTCIQFDISLYFHYQGSMACVCVCIGATILTKGGQQWILSTWATVVCNIYSCRTANKNTANII